MKYLKNIFFTIGIICLLFIPNKIFASTILTCDKEVLSASQSTTCSISIQGINETITSFSGTVSLSANLELVSSKDAWDGNTNSGQFNLNSESGNTNIGTIIVKLKEGTSNSTENISIKNISINGQSFNDISTTINVPALSNPNLGGLSISAGNLSPQFNENKTNYSATVEVSKITINAIAPNKGSVSGAGTKDLNYGTNTFEVVSKAEDGTTKTYTITINRLDTEKRLDTLSPIVSTKFNTGTTLYNETIPSDQDTFTLSATPKSSRAQVTYSPSETINLNKGETKTITVTVTAENGDIKTYTVNVTRKDDRNSNNTLKNLTIKDNDIKFKSNTTSYKLTVKNNIEEIEINGETSDKNAKVEGFGKHKINVGSNTIKIVVTAQNGSKKTYTITIIREDENGNIEKLSNNTKIKNIKINNEDLNIKENVFTYSLSVENNINIVDLTYELEDEKTSAVIEGNNELVVGNNRFKIIVTAEDGTTKTYEILIERKELNNTLENNKESILDAIKNSENDVIIITVKNDDLNRIIDKEILEELKEKNKTLTYEVLNEYKGLNYSITIKGKDITNSSESLDYELSFKSKNQNTIESLSNNAKTIYLNFNGQGKLPGLSKFKIFVGDKFNDKDKLYLYYFNEETNKLELIKSNLKIEDKYVEFELKHFSEYILVNSLISSNKESNSNEANIKLTSIGLIIIGFILIGLIIFMIIKKKKNNSNEKNINVTSNTNVNSDTKTEIKNVSLKDEIKVEKQEVKEEPISSVQNNETQKKEENDDVEIIDM